MNRSNEIPGPARSDERPHGRIFTPSSEDLDDLAAIEADLNFIHFAIEALALRANSREQWRLGMSTLKFGMRCLRGATTAAKSDPLEEPSLNLRPPE